MTLEQRWLGLWKRLDAQGDASAIYKDLAARYARPYRVYHALTHIEHCLDEFERVRYLAINLGAVELALWYHDAEDSEEGSARLATVIVRNALLPNNFGRLVANLIMATKHTTVPTDFDAQLIVDIDLSILGQPEDEFDEYELRIRREYEWVDDAAFITGRSAILQSFLDRPNIYSTPSFRDRYEASARRNLVRSLARLRA